VCLKRLEVMGLVLAVVFIFVAIGYNSYDRNSLFTESFSSVNLLTGAVVGDSGEIITSEMIQIQVDKNQSSFQDDFGKGINASAYNNTVTPGNNMSIRVIDNNLSINGTAEQDDTNSFTGWLWTHDNASQSMNFIVNFNFTDTSSTFNATDEDETAVEAWMGIGLFDKTDSGPPFPKGPSVYCVVYLRYDGTYYMRLDNESNPNAPILEVDPVPGDGQMLFSFNDTTGQITCEIGQGEGYSLTAAGTDYKITNSEMSLFVGGGMNYNGPGEFPLGDLNLTFVDFSYITAEGGSVDPPPPPPETYGNLAYIFDDFTEGINLTHFNSPFFADARFNFTSRSSEKDILVNISLTSEEAQNNSLESYLQTQDNLTGGDFIMSAHVFLYNFSDTLVGDVVSAPGGVRHDVGLAVIGNNGGFPAKDQSCTASLVGGDGGGYIEIILGNSSTGYITVGGPTIGREDPFGRFGGNITFSYDNDTNTFACDFTGDDGTVFTQVTAPDSDPVSEGEGVGLYSTLWVAGQADNMSGNAIGILDDFNFSDGSVNIGGAEPETHGSLTILIDNFNKGINLTNFNTPQNQDGDVLGFNTNITNRSRGDMMFNTSLLNENAANDTGALYYYTNDNVSGGNFTFSTHITFYNYTTSLNFDNTSSNSGTRYKAGIGLVGDNGAGSVQLEQGCYLTIATPDVYGKDNSVTLQAYNTTHSDITGAFGPPMGNIYSSGNLTLTYYNDTNNYTCSFVDDLDALTSYKISFGEDTTLEEGKGVSLFSLFESYGSGANMSGNGTAIFDDFNYTNIITVAATPPPVVIPMENLFDNFPSLNGSYLNNTGSGLNVIPENNLILLNGSVNYATIANAYVYLDPTGLGTVGGSGFTLSAYVNITNTSNSFYAIDAGNGNGVISNTLLGLFDTTNKRFVAECVIRHTGAGQFAFVASNNTLAEEDIQAAATGDLIGNLSMTYNNGTKEYNCTFNTNSIVVNGTVADAETDAGVSSLVLGFGTTLSYGGSEKSSGNVSVTFDDLNYSITGPTVSQEDYDGSGANLTQCYLYNANEGVCIAQNCVWQSFGDGGWCEIPQCHNGQGTNQTYCENLNETFSLTMSCTWDNSTGQEWCESGDGNFIGSACSDYNGDATSCYNTFFCEWNSEASTCGEPSGGIVENNFNNPNCATVPSAGICGNITGCSWSGTACSGNSLGIQCSYLSQTICSEITFLGSCCSWDGSACAVSRNQDCYTNVPDYPAGQTYCQDTGVLTNQTGCEYIAGSPWYLPCKFNQSGNEECNFNNEAFSNGGSQTSFDEISSRTNCESKGGIWRTEQYSTNGVVSTDSWCEFNYGTSGNCDTTCWACEDDSGVTGLATAETVCEESALGYCEFTQDGNAQNGYGRCQAKQSFVEGGGKNVDDECSAADYLNEPESECVASKKGCIWVDDTTATNGIGNCYGKNEKRCGNDCFSCYTSTKCTTDGNGGSGACTWDTVTYICKPAGYTSEICFDGSDNDADGKVDCLDSECGTNKFCGGSELSASFGDCPGYTPSGNETCIDSNCVWVLDDFQSEHGGEGAGFCDFPGAQCTQYDDDQATCATTSGCSFLSGTSFCHENDTLADTCFTQSTSIACDGEYGCGWVEDANSPNGGRCQSQVFSQCFGNDTRRASEDACEENIVIGGQSIEVCSWTEDQFSPQGGYCDPVCFSLAPASCDDSNTKGLCTTQGGYCEPTAYGGKCDSANGNITQCNDDLNSTCTYSTDSSANNGLAGSLGNTSGWCNPKGDAGFVNFMGDIKPSPIGTSPDDGSINDSWDIKELLLRDDFDRIVFGTKLYDNFTKSGVCNNAPTYSGGALGAGTANHTFFWYLDSDGDTTNNCASRDNNSMTGFEFSFKYQGIYGAGLTETKVSYRCVDGNWAATPIPLTSDKQKMCALIGGGMAGVDKSELFKFSTLFNKSADFRLYIIVTNVTNNDSDALDTSGPHYYSSGAMDFKFENCADSSGDADGDGIDASNDPDCFNFLQFGYVPIEIGFQCGDGMDNDGDGLTDCDDFGCSFDPFNCGGALVVDENDKTAPGVIWQQATTFPDSAFVMYDTSEPANGTLTFYDQDSECATINKTIRDAGILDNFIETYKMWHDGPIDNLGYNPEAIGSLLPNGTNFYYKTTVCDISNNCAVSACLNFTTKASIDSCKSCTTTFNFPFVSEVGSDVSDPLGNILFTIELPNGTAVNLSSNADSGKQFNYSETKNFNFEISNPNSTQSWCLKLINASVSGKVSSGIQNFSAIDGDVGFNSTTNGTFVGLGNSKCQELINIFRPKKLEICIPGNNSDLWQCDDALTNCTKKNIGTNATNMGYDAILNITKWQVPAEWGC